MDVGKAFLMCITSLFTQVGYVLRQFAIDVK